MPMTRHLSRADRLCELAVRGCIQHAKAELALEAAQRKKTKSRKGQQFWDWFEKDRARLAVFESRVKILARWLAAIRAARIEANHLGGKK